MRPPSLAAVLALCAAIACGPDEPGSDELVFAIGANPANLDPRLAPDAWSDRITRLIHSTLLQRTASGDLVPHLASAVERPGPTSWVVRLRADARFHDGRPVLSSDVAATFRSVLDPELGSVKRASLEPLARIETPDDRTVVFVLDRPTATFGHTLAAIGIAPEGLGDRLVGSGPFVFERHVQGERIVLRRNDDWFGGEVAMPRLVFKIVPDATVRTLEVLHGSTDLTQNDLPPHVIERLASEPDLRVRSGPSAMVKYIAFNVARGPLADARVRQAIAHAIDRDPIIEHKLRDQATSAISFLRPESWAYESECRRWEHNPDRARELLDRAGYPEHMDGPRFELVWRTSEDPTSLGVATVIARQLARVGVAIDLRSNEWGVFFSDIGQGDFDLYTLTGVGIQDPDWYSFVVHSDRIPPRGGNRPRYRDPEVDRLLDEARALDDRDARAVRYRTVQRTICADVPILPLWYQHNIVVGQRGVVGYEATPDGDFTSLPFVRKEATR